MTWGVRIGRLNCYAVTGECVALLCVEIGKLPPLEVPAFALARTNSAGGKGGVSGRTQWLRATWDRELWLPLPLPSVHRRLRLTLWAKAAGGRSVLIAELPRPASLKALGEAVNAATAARQKAAAGGVFGAGGGLLGGGGGGLLGGGGGQSAAASGSSATTATTAPDEEAAPAVFGNDWVNLYGPNLEVR